MSEAGGRGGAEASVGATHARSPSHRCALALAATLLVVGAAPSATAGMRLSLTPERLSISPERGGETRVVVTLTSSDGSPLSGVRLLGEATHGSIGLLRETARGRYEGWLRVPAGDAPRQAIVVVSPLDDAEVEVAQVLLPIHLDTELAARTEPRARVLARVGARTYGPVRSGPDGSFSLPIVVAPGDGRADVEVVDRAGNVTTARIPLPSATHDPIALTLDATRVPTDGTKRVRLTAFAFDIAGEPLRAPAPRASARRGATSDLVDHGDGAWTGWYEPPADATTGTDRVVASIVLDGVVHEAARTVRLVRGPPASLELSATPAEILAGSDETVEVVAWVRDAAGRPLPGHDVHVVTDRGRLSELVDRGDGSHRAVLEPPEAVEAGTIELKAFASVGEPQRWPAALEVTASPEVLPASWRAFSLLSARVSDADGRPIPGELVLFTLVSGEGTLTPTAVTNDRGVAFADFAATPTAGAVVVETRAASVPDLRASVRLETREDAAAALMSRPAIAAQGGSPGGAFSSGEGHRTLHASALVRIQPDAPARLTASASPASVPADGRSTSRIIALVTDARGNGIDDVTFELTSDRGTVGPASNVGDGRHAATWTAPAGAGDGRAIVTVREPRAGLESTVAIALEPGPPTSLELEAEPATLPADGTSTSRLVVRVSDASGVAVPAATVTFALERGDAAVADDVVVTGPDGVARASLVAGLDPGPVEIVATTSSTDATVEARTTLDLLPLPPARLMLELTPTRLAVGERAEGIARVEDALGRSLELEGVLFEIEPPSLARLTRPRATTDASGHARVALLADAPGSVVVVARSETTPGLIARADVELQAMARFEIDEPVCEGAVVARALEPAEATHRWDVDGDGVADAFGRRVVLPLEAGVHEIVLVTESADGTRAIARRTVEIAAGPTAIARASADSAASGGSVRLDGSGSLAGSAPPLEHGWDLDGDGRADATGAVVASWSRPDGRHEATLLVRDDRSCTASATVSVVFGDLPDLPDLPDLACSVEAELPTSPLPAGDEAALRVRCENRGAAAARNVVLVARIEGDATITDAPGGAQADGKSVRFSLGTIEPGAAASVGFTARVRADAPAGSGTVAVVATPSHDADDANPADDAGSAVFPWSQRVDLSVAARRESSAPVPAGGEATLWLEVANRSMLDAPGARISLSWDGALLGAPRASVPVSATRAGGASLELGTVAAGDVLEPIELAFRAADVLPASSLQALVTATLVHASLDAAPDDNEERVTLVLAAEPCAWLVPRAEASPAPAVPRGRIDWRVDVGNRGSTDAAPVDLVVRLDPRVPTRIIDNPDGGVVADGDLNFRLGTLPADPSGGTGRTITWSERLPEGFPADVDSVSTELTLELAEPSCAAEPLTRVVRVPLSSRPDVSVSVTGPDRSAAGERVAWSVDVTNEGAVAATDVVLDLALTGADVELDPSSLPPGASSTATTASVPVGELGELGELGAGASSTLRIAARLADLQATADPVLSLSAETRHAVADADPADDSAVRATAVAARPNVAVELTVLDASGVPTDEAEPGEELTASVALVVGGHAPTGDGDLIVSWTETAVATPKPAVVAIPAGTLPGARLEIGSFAFRIRDVLPDPSTLMRVAARAALASPDEDPLDDEGEHQVIIAAQPNLSIRIASLPEAVNAGETFDVALAVRNDGATGASDVRVVVESSNAAIEILDGALLELGSVPADGIERSVTATARAARTLESASVVTCLDARVAAAEADEDPASNRDARCLDVHAAPDLALTLSVSGETSPARPAGRVTARALLTNAGSLTAQAPEVVIARDIDLLPAVLGSRPVLVLEAGEEVRAKLAPLPPGETVELAVDFQVAETLPSASVTTELTARAIDTLGLDPDPSNDDATASLSIAASVDLACELGADRAELAAGEPVALTARVTGRGGVEVTDARLVLSWDPTHFDVASAEGATLEPGRATWSALTVAADGAATSRRLALVSRDVLPASSIDSAVSASVTSGAIDIDPANDADAITLALSARAAPCVTLATTATSEPVPPGGEVSHVLDVTNDGSTAARSLIVRLGIDPAQQVAALDAGGGTASATGVEWNVASLDVGETLRLASRWRLADPMEDPVVVSTAEVWASAADACAPATSTLVVSGLPNLAVTQRIVATSDDPPTRGSLIDYEVTVVNRGDGAAAASALRDELSEHVSLVAAPGARILDAATVEWSVPELAAGEARVHSLRAAVDPALPVASHRLVNAAEVLPGGADATTLDDRSTLALGIVLDVDLRAELSCIPRSLPPRPGDIIDCSVVVANAGSVDATSVAVALDAGTLAAASETSLATADVPAGGRSAPAAFTVRLAPEMPDALNEIVVRATPTAAEPDGEPGNDADEATIDVAAEVDLRVTLEAAGALGPAPHEAGEAIAVTITLDNVGTRLATDVALDASWQASLATLAGGDLTGGGGSASTLAPTLAPADPPLTALLRLDVAGELPSTLETLTPCVTARAAEADAFDADNVDRCLSLAVVARPDLAVSTGLSSSETPPTPGGVVDVHLSVANHGTTTATGVIVRHAFDGELVAGLAGPAAGATQDGDTVVFDVGTLSVGATASLDHSLRLAAAMPEPDPTLVTRACASAAEADAAADDDCAGASLSIAARPDAHVEIAASPLEVDAAGEIAVSLRLTNLGTSPLRAPSLTLALPAELSVLDADGGTTAASALEWSPADIAPGGQFAVEPRLRVAPTLPAETTSLDLAAAAAHADTDANPADDAASVAVVARAAADLAVTLTRTSDPPEPGSTVEWRIDWRNEGTTTAAAAALLIEDPDLVEPPTEPDARVELGDVAPGVSGSHALSYRVPDALPAATNALVTRVTATSATTDLDPSDDVATASETVLACPDLVASLAVEAVPNPAAAGGMLRLTLAARNDGSTTARDARLVLAHDASLTSVADAGGGVALDSSTLEIAAGDIAVGASVQAIVELRIHDVLPEPDLVLAAGLQAAASDADCDPASAEAGLSIPIEALPDLRLRTLALTTTPDPAEAGGTVALELALDNAGATRAEAPAIALTWNESEASVEDAAGGVADGPGRLRFDASTGADGTLPVGDEVRFSPVLRIASTLPDPVTELVVSATASALEPDAAPADNSIAETVVVGAGIDLFVVPSGPAADLEARDAFVVAFDHGNEGTAPAEDVVIDVAYDPGLVRLWAGATEISPGVARITVGNLAAATIDLTASAIFQLIDVPPPPVRREHLLETRIAERAHGFARDVDTSDNDATATVGGCYQRVTLTKSSEDDLCLGGRVTLIAEADPPTGMAWSWRATDSAGNPAGTFTNPTSSTTEYLPPEVLGGFVVTVTATDTATGCAREAGVAVITRDDCTACDCGSQSPSLSYVSGSLGRADDPASTSVARGESVALRVDFEERAGRRPATLLGGQTRIEFSSGGATYAALLPRDVHVECSSTGWVAFATASVPADMPLGDHVATITWVADDSVAGAPCGTVEATTDTTNPDRITVVDAPTIQPGISISAWGPRTESENTDR